MARRTWWLRSPRGRVEIVKAGDLRGDDVVHPREWLARHWLDRWLDDAIDRFALTDLYEELVGRGTLLSSWTAQSRTLVRARLSHAFSTRELRMLEERRTVLPPSVPVPTDIDDLFTQPEEQHWIEVQLYDPDGAALANRRYSVTDPGGGAHTGALDAEGKARVEPIDPGLCQVSFPGLEPIHWGIRQEPR
jgi:hypothetical protein